MRTYGHILSSLFNWGLSPEPILEPIKDFGTAWSAPKDGERIFYPSDGPPPHSWAFGITKDLFYDTGMGIVSLFGDMDRNADLRCGGSVHAFTGLCRGFSAGTYYLGGLIVGARESSLAARQAKTAEEWGIATSALAGNLGGLALFISPALSSSGRAVPNFGNTSKSGTAGPVFRNFQYAVVDKSVLDTTFIGPSIDTIFLPEVPPIIPVAIPEMSILETPAYSEWFPQLEGFMPTQLSLSSYTMQMDGAKEIESGLLIPLELISSNGANPPTFEVIDGAGDVVSDIYLQGMKPGESLYVHLSFEGGEAKLEIFMATPEQRRPFYISLTPIEGTSDYSLRFHSGAGSGWRLDVRRANGSEEGFKPHAQATIRSGDAIKFGKYSLLLAPAAHGSTDVLVTTLDHPIPAVPVEGGLLATDVSVPIALEMGALDTATDLLPDIPTGVRRPK